MASSRWFLLTLAFVAVACDQAVPSAPTSDGGRWPRIEQVQAAEGSATITVSGNDEVGPQSIPLADYPDNLIADVTIEGAIHFDGDTTDTPDHLPSGDIGPAGFLVGATRCILRATVTFRIGGLGAQGDCPTTPTGPQTLTQTELIAGRPLFQMESANSTRNFCGPTVICVTWSGSFKLTIHPEQAGLALSIDNPSPDSGQTVTVTASAAPSAIAGIAVPISGLVWEVPGASCGGGLVCSFIATQSGEVDASAVVNGSTSNASVSLTVRAPIDSTHHDSIPGDTTGGCPAARRLLTSTAGPRRGGAPIGRAACGVGGGPTATLQCTPQTVTRGDNVSCVVLASAGGVLTEWQVTGADGNHTTPSGEGLSLQGRAVLSSTVGAQVRFPDGTIIHAQGVFTVQPRQWPQGVAKAQPFANLWSPTPGLAADLQLNYPPTGVTGQLGITSSWSFEFNAQMVTPNFLVVSGPNQGWMMTTAPMPDIEPVVYVNNGLMSSDPFYALQNGRRIPGAHTGNSATDYYCNQSQMDTYLHKTRQHEGSQPGLPSHYDVYVQQVPGLALNQHLESVVQFAGPDYGADSLRVFFDSITSTFSAWNSKIEAAQLALHSVQDGKVPIVCVFRQEGNP